FSVWLSTLFGKSCFFILCLGLWSCDLAFLWIEISGCLFKLISELGCVKIWVHRKNLSIKQTENLCVLYFFFSSSLTLNLQKPNFH
ncbi:hypothetical protein FRX31_023480, partial [Thalictrum thalictroides]